MLHWIKWLLYIDSLTCALAKAHVLFLVLHYCYDSHHVLRLVVGLVADLRISQSSVVPKRLHCPWADVERLTHVLRVEPLVHGLVLTALTDSVHALHEVLQLGIKLVECLFLEYDESHTFLFSKLILCYMSQSSTHMLCSTLVSAKIRHGNLKTSVFNFCGSMLPGFADFNAKNNKKNLHDCNEYMNYDELRNTLKFSQLSRYANKQATTKLPRYTQSVAWLHSVHLLCTRQSVNGANRDHYTNK